MVVPIYFLQLFAIVSIIVLAGWHRPESLATETDILL